MYCVLLVALTTTKLIPPTAAVCPGRSLGILALPPFTRHNIDPAVVLDTHASSTGPSPGRNMTSLGPWITGAPTKMK